MTIDQIAARLPRLRPVVCGAHLSFRRDGSSYHVPEQSSGPQEDYATAEKLKDLGVGKPVISEVDWFHAGSPPLEAFGYEHDVWNRCFRMPTFRMEPV